ncbi:macrolide 2'-phosphotransferase [Thermoleptolyngbya sp. C42_A2020_037]|uniref:macrolide 2'-phosphotransferase n=1 Tax=Thermoleptolyngbya sp. C42_A2020_037 TaxID=2747799 RepID=UPI0019E376BF|nr:macrolide 2'-phosphotransferase [Thermoleptolyngbya sp. C42_A2020_037]MBF2084237.1 macrolide 2'-phosphotransferase [Thermoleptolyngbya sp. C42_A2020_037]
MIKNTKSQQEVLELAHQNGLAIEGDSIQFNESGLDFQVALATDADGIHWILRLPRREDVLPSVDQERRTLELIAPRINVDVPRWAICTDELIAYRALNGVPLGTIDPEAKAYVWEIDLENLPEQFHKSLAKGIVSLHQVSVEKARAAGLPVKTTEEVRVEMQHRMESVKQEFEVDQTLWERWQSWLHDDEIWMQETVLTHGELHAGHILIDKQARVTGFIDWTEASVTDPAKDFVAYYRTFGKNALRQLISAYAESGGHTWSKMAEHVIELNATVAIDVAEFALRSGLDEYKQMAVQMLSVGELA